MRAAVNLVTGPSGAWLKRCPYQRQQLAVFRVAAGLLFRVDQLAVDGHLEHSAPGWQQRPFADLLAEVRENLIRRTDGSWQIVSLLAVFD